MHLLCIISRLYYLCLLNAPYIRVLKGDITYVLNASSPHEFSRAASSPPSPPYSPSQNSSHGVTKLSYGEDGIIINTTPYSHQGNIWKSFTRGQNLGSSFLPAREPINGCLFHASQELVLIRLSFLGA